MATLSPSLQHTPKILTPRSATSLFEAEFANIWRHFVSSRSTMACLFKARQRLQGRHRLLLHFFLWWYSYIPYFTTFRISLWNPIINFSLVWPHSTLYIVLEGAWLIQSFSSFRLVPVLLLARYLMSYVLDTRIFVSWLGRRMSRRCSPTHTLIQKTWIIRDSHLP